MDRRKASEPSRRGWFTTRLASPNTLGGDLAKSLLDPLGVYIALLCVQLPPWEAVLTCGLSCVQPSIVLKPGIQARAPPDGLAGSDPARRPGR